MPMVSNLNLQSPSITATVTCNYDQNFYQRVISFNLFYSVMCAQPSWNLGEPKLCCLLS